MHLHNLSIKTLSGVCKVHYAHFSNILPSLMPLGVSTVKEMMLGGMHYLCFYDVYSD